MLLDGCLVGSAVGESVGAGAGFDDGAVEGESVHDGGEPRVGNTEPHSCGKIRRDGDAGSFLAFGDDLEQQLRPAGVVRVDPPAAASTVSGES